MNFLALPDTRPSCKAWLTADRILFSRTRKHLSFLLTSVENRLLTAVFFFFAVALLPQLLSDLPADSEGTRPQMWSQLPAIGGRQRQGSGSHHRRGLPAERAGGAAALRSSDPPRPPETTCCSTVTFTQPHSPTPSPLGSRDSTSAPTWPPYSQRDMLHV